MGFTLRRNSWNPRARLLGLAMASLVSAGCSCPASRLDGLAAKLRDARPEVRQIAVMELAASRDDRAFELLVSGLEDSAPGVRFVVAHALGERDEPRALWPLLKHAAREEEDYVLHAVVVSILRLGIG